MDRLLQDIRYCLRTLIKNPGFTCVAVLTLALGIGANTAIFSVVNSVLLRPLPYPNSDRLVALRSNQSGPDLADVESRTQSFQAIGGVTQPTLDFTGGSEPLQVKSAQITQGLVEVLGMKPYLGRMFTKSEDRFGADRTVVLSYGFWKRQFGGDRNLIGKNISLSGNSYSVIGILPEGFDLPQDSVDVWVLVRVANADAVDAVQDRAVHFLRTIGLLKKDANLNQARAEMKLIDRQLEQIDPVENRDRHTELISLQERIVGKTRPALLILLGAVALVLLIACANFANLLLSRALSRQQEILIRTALGAGRARLLQQLLTESILIALIGGSLGLLFAYWGIDLLRSLEPDNLPRLSQIAMDNRVLLFTMAISVLTGFIFGLIPSWATAAMDVGESLKETSRSTTPGSLRHRIRNALVVGELALALLLLVGAGLLIRAFWMLHSVDPGFNPDKILTTRIELPESRYEELPSQTRFRQSLLQNLNEKPGVRAAMISEIPLTNDWLFHNFIIEGRPAIARGAEPEIHTRSVAGDYFHIMQIPIVRGRDFTDHDQAGSLPVVIVNQATVRKYFPNQNPIGLRVRWAADETGQWMTIVGVVGDVKHFGLGLPEEPALYTPYAQLPYAWKRWTRLVVKSSESPAALTQLVKNQVWKLDKQLPVTEVQSMNEIMATSLARQRFNMIILGVFAGVALLLAAVGIYGVVSYSVAQRSHEIGIRMALGAESGHVLKMVVKEGLLLALIGVVIGVVAAFGLTRFMASLLFGVGVTDMSTFIGVALILTGVAVFASYIPARRATKVDPMIALRYE